jgi:hypothetical protein
MYLFFNLAAIGFPMILVYGLFLFVSIFSLTSMMDKAKYGLPSEIIRCIFGLSLMYFQGGDWFGISSNIEFAKYLIAGYFFISPFIVLIFQNNKLVFKGA